MTVLLQQIVFPAGERAGESARREAQDSRRGQQDGEILFPDARRGSHDVHRELHAGGIAFHAGRIEVRDQGILLRAPGIIIHDEWMIRQTARRNGQISQRMRRSAGRGREADGGKTKDWRRAVPSAGRSTTAFEFAGRHTKVY